MKVGRRVSLCEIGLRKNVYPSFVARKKMTQAEADQHIARMDAVYLTLKWVEAHADELRAIAVQK